MRVLNAALGISTGGVVKTARALRCAENQRARRQHTHTHHVLAGVCRVDIRRDVVRYQATPLMKPPGAGLLLRQREPPA